MRNRVITAGGVKRKRVSMTVLLAGAIILGGLAVYMVFWTEALKIRKVTVTGNETVSEAEIRELLAGASYIFDKVEIGELPLLIRKIEPEKKYLKGEVILKVEEREKYAEWCYMDDEGEQCRWFDRDGVVFAEAPRARGPFILAVEAPYAVAFGERVMEERMLSNMMEIFQILGETGVITKSIKIEDIKKEEMEVLTDSNLPIYFSLREKPEYVAQALRSLKSDFGSLEYIDLRSRNRAFYR